MTFGLDDKTKIQVGWLKFEVMDTGEIFTVDFMIIRTKSVMRVFTLDDLGYYATDMNYLDSDGNQYISSSIGGFLEHYDYNGIFGSSTRIVELEINDD